MNIEELKTQMTSLQAEITSIRKGITLAEAIEAEAKTTDEFFADEMYSDADMLASVVADMAANHERKLARARKFAQNK